jgi:RHS repeat-associated protein
MSLPFAFKTWISRWRTAMSLMLTINLMGMPLASQASSLESKSPQVASPGVAGNTNESTASVGFTQRDDGKNGMPASPSNSDSLTPATPPSKHVRETRVARIALKQPIDSVVESNERFVLSGIPEDADGNAIHGLWAEWESSDRSVVAVTKDGEAWAGKPGKALLKATAGSKQEVFHLTVVDTGNQSRLLSNPLSSLEDERRLLVAQSQTATRPVRSGRDRLRAHSLSMIQSGPEQLPDYEIPSIYQPGNALGSVQGKTAPGAQTPAAATDGTEMPGSSNFSFSLPLLNLPGRGLNAAVSLIHNSRQWNKSGESNGATRMYYNFDKSWLAPGFQISLGQLRVQSGFVTLIDPDGTRHEMINDPEGSTVYESIDGTFIRLDNGVATYPDGTQVTYGATGLMAGSPPATVKQPIKITDRHGNFLLISYLPGSFGTGVGPRRISSIQDTLGRYIQFYYDSNKSLVAVTAPGLTGQADLPLMRFYYQDITVNQPGLFQPGITVTAPTTAHVLKYVYLPSATETTNAHLGYRFDYSAYGIVYQTTQFRGMTISTAPDDYSQTGSITGEGLQAAVTTYNYETQPSNLGDVPTFTQRTDDWAGRVAALPIHYFSVDQTTGVATVTSPDGTISETHTILNPGQWDNGLISRTIIKTAAKTFADSVYTWQPGYNGANPRMVQVQTTNDAGQTKAVLYGYDPASNFNNISSVSERDFATPGSPGAELRRTETTYVNEPDYWNRGLIGLASSTRTLGLVNGAMTVVARTDYFYDETAPTSYGDISSMMYLDPSTNVRGNLTRTRSYPDLANLDTYIDRTATYDVAGNLLTAQVACCQQKSFSYPSYYNYAYLASETDGNGPTLTTTAAYDFNSGVVANATDVNNLTTVWYYHASSLRPEHVVHPDGGGAYYEYNDSLLNDAAGRQHFFVKTSVRLDSRLVASYRYLDGRGSPTQTFEGYTAATGWSTRDYEYDGLGRGVRTSNPYYSAGYGQSSINPSGLWSNTTLDNLGRVVETSFPSGDSQNPTTSYARVAYAGSDVLATDPAGKQRLSRTNALGQLTDVWEIKTADPATEPITFPAHAEVTAGYRTTYKRDTTGNLVQVTQSIPGGVTQNRYFKFDSLGQLTHERQVEQGAPHSQNDPVTGNNVWSRRYSYNSQGQVADVYDALQVNTHLVYDGLNRVTGISHSDGTPSISFFYDQARPGGYYNQGLLTSVTTAPSGNSPQTTLEYDYQKQGQVAAHRQQIGTTTFTTAYSFNAGGLLLSETYPSGRVLTNSYDEAGRLASVGDSTGAIYANGFSFAPHGGLLSETLGNGTTHTMAYNNALQPKQVKLSSAGAEIQRYDYLYGKANQTSGAVDTGANNGQLGRVDSFIAGTKQWDQRFSYDDLGRLSQAAEYQGNTGALTYQAHYDFDRFGNRFQYQQNVNLNYMTVQPGDVVSATNRLISTGIYATTYDDKGNTLTDARFRGLSYTYDVNNRQLTATGNGVSQSSVYDAGGNRVQTTSSGVVRQTVYDAFGQSIADYSGGVLQRENIYRGGQLLAVFEPGSSSPSGLTANPSNSNVALSWSVASGAANYRIERKGAGQSYGFVNATASTSFTDTAAILGSAYLYRVCAADAQDNCTSSYSNIALGARLNFPTDSTITGIIDDPTGANVTKVKAAHITELRTAVNAVRSLAGQSSASWTYPNLTAGDTIHADDVRDLRVKLDEALVALAIQTSSYTDSTLATGANGTLIKKAHVTEPRQRSTSGAGAAGSGGTIGGLKYVLQDIQGSTRVVMNGASVVARNDFLPYGEQINAGVGMRTTAQGYGSASVNQKYALTDRDETTGLDHTWWRKYENTAGRWTSPDPYLGSMSVKDPQSFNRYTYVSNDPNNFVDPTGLGQCYVRVQVWNLAGKTETSILGIWCEGKRMSAVLPQRAKVNSQSAECASMRERLLGDVGTSAAIDSAWERSQATTTQPKHEEGGLFGRVMGTNSTVDSVFLRQGSEQGSLSGFGVWAQRKIRQNRDTTTFEFWYHTHPHEAGEIVPGEGVAIAPEFPTGRGADLGVSTDIGLPGVLITKKRVSVFDENGFIRCYWDR